MDIYVVLLQVNGPAGAVVTILGVSQTTGGAAAIAAVTTGEPGWAAGEADTWVSSNRIVTITHSTLSA